MHYIDNDLYNISNKIKILRTTKSLTQKQLADLLEIEVSLISKYETQAAFPSLIVLKKLCQVFDISADEFLGLKDKEFIDYETILKSSIDMSGLTDEDINFVKATIKHLKSKNK